MMQDKYKAGLEEDLAKGRAKAKEKEAQTVRNFYEKNVPLETIAECTNQSLVEVNNIISAK